MLDFTNAICYITTVATVVIKKSAMRILRRMDRTTAERITNALGKLEEDPDRRDLDVKALRGQQAYRLRVGRTWRVIFERADDTITVQEIRPRGQAYRR